MTKSMKCQLMTAALLVGASVAAAAQTAATAKAGSLTTTPSLFSYSSSWSGAMDNGSAAETRLAGLSIGPNAAADPQNGGGRRRPYGRPTYKDKSANPDGSTKVAFEIGTGFDHPAGFTQKYQTTGWDFSVGVGRNFNRAFGVLAQYDYDNMGIPNSILSYFTTATGTQLGGNAHVWSLTLNPVINISNKNSKYGAYVVMGGGFYRKMTTFTTPTTGLYCDPYYGYCYYATTNATYAHWSNNAGGINGGVGFTYKPSSFSNMKLFMEARYTWVDNQASPNNTASNGYPPANYRTDLFPVTFGVRF